MSAVPFYLSGGAASARATPLPRRRVPLLEDAAARDKWFWIADAVARRHGVSVAAMLGCGRDSVVSAARRDLCTCLWASGLAYAAVGRLLGLDHTSVMRAIDKELER